MKGTGIAFLSIIACILMMLPSISFAELAPAHNVPSYSYNGMTLSFENQKAEIVANGQSFTVSWVINLVNNGTSTQEKFNASTIKRIDNTNQNSFAILLKNRDVHVAEIYSFNSRSIDASIALKSFRSSNVSYIATFVLTTNHRDHVSITGFSGGPLILPWSLKTIMAPINQGSWGYDDQYIHLSWVNEMSMFHSGLLLSTFSNNIVSLPFGPFTLAQNETYSIDPTITPDVIKPPPGGGGGGGSGSAPSIGTNPLEVNGNYVSTSYNTFAGGTVVFINGTIVSMGGASKVEIDYYADTESGGQIFLEEQNYTALGPFSFKWNSVPGDYSVIEVYATNSYGTTSLVQGPEMKIYTDFPSYVNGQGYVDPKESQKTISLYDSNSVLYGYLTEQMHSDLNTPTQNYMYRLWFESAFTPINSTTYGTYNDWETNGGVNAYWQNFSFYGNSLGMTSAEYPNYVSNEFDEAGYQYNVNNSNFYLNPEQFIWIALQSILSAIPYPQTMTASALMAIMYPIVFENDPTTPTVKSIDNSNGISVGYNAGFFPEYFFIGYNGHDCLMFNFTDKFETQFTTNGYTTYDALLNYFYFDSTFWVMPSAYNSPMESSISEPIYIAQIS